jgi:hypothetical protein
MLLYKLNYLRSSVKRIHRHHKQVHHRQLHKEVHRGHQQAHRYRIPKAAVEVP